MVDEVNDLIVPGAFAHTLATRRVKAVWHHEWKDAVGVVLDVEEWMPGDPRFADVPDWPAEAGALVATVEYNRRTSKGRDTYEQVKQWYEHGEAAFSIGYRVPADGATRRGDGVRVIHRLDLFEVSPVLHGAHPMTRALEVKAAANPGMEYKATPNVVELDAGQGEDRIKVAGLAVKAEDTGRVLLIQRALDDEDPAAGTWEFPGGHLDEGEDALAAAVREWQEETGAELPGATSVVGSWTAPNGIYRGFVAVVPGESYIPLNRPHGERRVANPDDPDGDATEVTAWWPITALPDMSLLRPACRDTPWSLLAGASLPQGPTGKQPSAQAQQFAAGVMNTYAALGGQEAKSARATVATARALLPRFQHKSARTTVAEAKAAGGMDKNRGDAEQLRHWYVRGEGAAQIGWGTPGDFDRCVGIAGRHMSPDNAKGYCNLRHKDALGIYPATHAAESKSARRSVLEAKARLAALGESVKPIQPLPASFEQIRDRLGQAVRTLLATDDDTWACIHGTYPDHVIASVHSDGADEEHYLIPYALSGDDVEMGQPQRVELATVVVADNDESPREADEAEEIDARVVQPTVEALSDATARINTSGASPDQLEGVRDKVRTLIAALSSKGLDVDAPGTDPAKKPTPAASSAAAGPTGMDLWDDSTFYDDEDDDEVPTEEPPAAAAEDDVDEDGDTETVRLDEDEVKSALAMMRS
ncbi:NUDIX domain-containing protein [Streptomyces collinus]|uniref:NUDIX domain-containing protein n=1 Tax=Streptomyces collinus TaxID=42684 RepID=UPI003636CA3F